MAVFSRATFQLWPIVLVAVLAPAVPIGLELAKPSPTPPAPRGDYPIRLELPPARAPARGEAAAGVAPGGPAVEFDVSASGAADESGGSAIEIRKSVRLNGADAGSATIRVSAGSTLSISANELRALLARARRGELAEQIGARDGSRQFVDFEAMRRLGIDVRYDVATDRIVIAA